VRKRINAGKCQRSAGLLFSTPGLTDHTDYPILGLETAAAAEATITPGLGLVTTAGQVPGEYRELNQAIGLGIAAVVGQIPVAMGADQPGVGAISAGGLIPSLLTELLITPTVGAVGVAGLVPSVFADVPLQPGLGQVTADGLIPTLVLEAIVTPGVGAIIAIGLQAEMVEPKNTHEPTLWTELRQNIGAGLATLDGLAPSLLTELLVSPDVGLALLEGRQPVVDTGGVVVEATAEPGVGLVTLGGLDPSLTVEYDKPRGHVTVKKRRRGRTHPVYEESRGAIAVVKLPPELTPTPVAYWDPPADAIAGIDTAALASVESSLRNLEASQARRSKRRREEEEIIALWLRAA
jgi:hypothetical protein